MASSLARTPGAARGYPVQAQGPTTKMVIKTMEKIQTRNDFRDSTVTWSFFDIRWELY